MNKVNFFNANNPDIYLTPPTVFIQENYPNLLPSWQNYPLTIGIILFFSDRLVSANSLEVETEKNRLRDKFLQWGHQLRLKALKNNALIEIIDPQNGYPIHSAQGTISFDIVAIVRQQLGFTVKERNGCKLLNHPTQKTAIYPCLLLANSQEKDLQSLLLSSP